MVVLVIESKGKNKILQVIKTIRERETASANKNQKSYCLLSKLMQKNMDGLKLCSRFLW